jgi:hypothetical protein
MRGLTEQLASIATALSPDLGLGVQHKPKKDVTNAKFYQHYRAWLSNS